MPKPIETTEPSVPTLQLLAFIDRRAKELHHSISLRGKWTTQEAQEICNMLVLTSRVCVELVLKADSEMQIPGIGASQNPEKHGPMNSPRPERDN